MRMKVYSAAAAAIMLAGAGPVGSDREPGGYAVRLRVEPVPAGGVQRAELPATALAALRSRDASDIRIFDGRGRLVPIARIRATSRLRQVPLSVQPILGARDTRMGARVSVRLDDRGRARVAEVESADATESDDATGGDVAILGALLDARVASGRADRLAFEADIPAGQPVRFTVEASRDLDDWRQISERVLYRPPGSAPVDARIALGSQPLDRDYLRVTWRAASPLIAPVSLRNASLVTSAGQGPVSIPAQAPALVDGNAVEFLAPAAPIVSLRVTPAGGDGPIPVRILGKDEAEQPWTVLASGIAGPDRPAMILRSAAPRRIRIEPGSGGAGFSTPPRLEFGFAPQAVAFLTSGSAPLTLAVGREGAADVFAELEMLGGRAEPPEARVEPGEPITPLVLAAPDESSARHLRFVLWLVLLGAVALLAGLVWLSWRRTPEP